MQSTASDPSQVKKKKKIKPNTMDSSLHNFWGEVWIQPH